MSSSQILHAERESKRALGSALHPAGFVLPLMLLALGFILRMVNAVYRFLNPDEVLHYLLSVAPSVRVAEHASLTTSHPPLLIIFLYYWRMLGHPEWLLRLPHVLAGTAFCWVMFVWLRRVTNQGTALIGLALWLFSPTLIQMSAEVRQYAFLLLFSSLSLYFLENGIAQDSPWSTLFSALTLYLALLVHYAALIVALTLGIYALMRWKGAPTSVSARLTWIGGQLGAIAVIAGLFVHHVSKLRARGQPQEVAETYARRSIFWPGEEHAWTFVGRNTVRIFHYFFNQGAVGVLALLLFICGIALLVRSNHQVSSRKPSSRQLAFLFVLPFAVNSITGLLQLYPYGGSRHDVYLAMFAMPAISVPLAVWKPKWRWLKPLALAIILAVSNLFPAPLAEYLRFRDQNRRLMTSALASLRALPADAIIFTDDQGGMMLSYYLCNKRVVQIEQEPPAPFFKERCGDQWVISLDPRLWIFRAETFPDSFERMRNRYGLGEGTPLWFFQSGWYIDREVALREELKGYGCSAPHSFGRNIFLCQIEAGR